MKIFKKLLESMTNWKIVNKDFFSEYLKISNQNREYHEEVISLRKQLIEQDALREKEDPIHSFFVSADTRDPMPKDSGERARYVATIAGLHTDYIKPKIIHMISNAHKLLENTGNDRDYDLMVKGAIFTLREFNSWGDRMIIEHLSNINAPAEELKKDN